MVTPSIDSEDAVLRTRVSRFQAIEQRRKAIGAPVSSLVAHARIAARSYRRWLDGDRVPSFWALKQLTSAIAELEREALGQ